MPNYRRFFLKSSDQFRPYFVERDDYTIGQIGDEFSQQYPFTSSIDVSLYSDPTNILTNQLSGSDQNRYRINSLKTALKHGERLGAHYSHDYTSGDVCMVNIPAVFYGSSIKKGSVSLKTYKDGLLLAELRDSAQNGDLKMVYLEDAIPTNDQVSCGCVLYEQGIILLHNTDPLDDTYEEEFYFEEPEVISVPDNPRWINWGISYKNQKGRVVRTSYDISFSGTHSIPEVILMAHAPRGEFNHSNNPTYIKWEDSERHESPKWSETSYAEDDTVEVKNIAKTNYETPEPNFRKETYISKILIYDDNRKVIGVAKISNPVRKNISRDYTFKLKLRM
jgi:hypothetical protein